ncbi:MAG: ATP-binding protein [Pseudomonadota bacterium]|nr:ATP-binding protein [Pseudomonadota bacterium]
MDKKRYLKGKINRLLEMFPIVAIVGARQCGKTTLAMQLRPEWKYYDLESPGDYQLLSEDPAAFFALHQHDLIIDEAQQYPELFRVLRGVVDADRRRKGRFILTGSSSPHIVKAITESLAGRIATVEMWPFKQGEFYQRKIPELYNMLIDGYAVAGDFAQLPPVVEPSQSVHVWFKGGFPEPLIESEHRQEFLRQWQENYVADYITRDIRGLFPKLKMHNFRRLLTLLAQFSGHQLNMSDMARALEISVSTVKDYLDIIHQTFIWRNLAPYTKNSLKKVQKAKKGFFRDQGLLHYFLKIANADHLLLHPVAGFSFESFVIEEIIRGLQTTMAAGLEFNYYRTIDKSEVDLIIEGDFGIIPIEIKLNSTVRRRSLRGLENFIKDRQCSFGIIVNRGRGIELITDKIVQVPVHYL